MKNKNISNEKLADMIETGFEHVLGKINTIEEKMATKEQVEKLNSRMMKVEIRIDNVEEEISTIRKHQIAHTIYRDEFDKLSDRVRALEKLIVKHS